MNNTLYDMMFQAISFLNEIDDYGSKLNELLSEVDCKLSDLYHKIENNKYTTSQCYRIVREIRKLRLYRREIKNNIELYRLFKENQNKLLHPDNRKIFQSQLASLHKKLSDSEYRNRVYTEEELNEIIGE